MVFCYITIDQFSSMDNMVDSNKLITYITLIDLYYYIILID